MSYKIGSWNMRNLGDAASDSADRDLDTMAQIIRDGRFDVIAMQEVLGSGQSVQSLCTRLGGKWQMRFLRVPSSDGSEDKRQEGYAFLWNGRRLTPVESRDNFTLLTQHTGSMARDPAYARFTPNGLLGGCYCELRLICVHLYYGSASGGLDIAQRQAEYDVLMHEIYPRIADKRYGDNMPAYTVVLGDYNLNLLTSGSKSPYCEKEVEVEPNGRRIVVTVQDQKTTLRRDDADENGDVFANNFDHFSYDVGRFRGVNVNYGRINAVQQYYGSDAQTYKKEISDHLPIRMQIALR